MTWSVEVRTGSAGETRSLAASLATVCRPGDVVLLVGGLGAGKTTFAQGFARGLGVAGPVTSPTFTLVRQYPVQGAAAGVHQLLHADVYRLDSLAEVADLGLPELVEDGAVALVEWGDVAAPVLGRSTLAVRLTPVPGGEAAADEGDEGDEGQDELRQVTVVGDGPGWVDRRTPVVVALAPFAGPVAAPAPGPASRPGSQEQP